MNIFKTKGDILGCRQEGLSENSLHAFFCFTSQVRGQLGGKGYLLDHYLSLFFEAVNASLAMDAADEGFRYAGRYQTFCFDALDGSDAKKENPIYAKVKEVLHKHPEFLSYQEAMTRMNLLYAAMADVFLADALAVFIKEQENTIASVIDAIRMAELYEQISNIIGESVMESLNLKLKQNFLVAQLVPVFIQGFANDLLYRLTSRDIETSKQVFQLLSDSMPEDKEGE